VVDLSQLGGSGDPDRVEKMRDIAPVGVAGAGALLFLQPDFFLGGQRSRNRERNRQAGLSGRGYCWLIVRTHRFLR
jgi:hypothetical protein